MHYQWALCAALLIGPAAVGQTEDDQKQAGAETTVAERIDKLRQEYDAAMQTFFVAYQSAGTDEERQKLVDESYPDGAAYGERFMALSQEATESADALKCLEWVVSRGQDADATKKAIGMLLDQHVESPGMKDICPNLLYAQGSQVEPLLRAVAERNPDREAQGQALITLGRYLNTLGARCRDLRAEQNAETIQNYREFYGDEWVDNLRQREPAEFAAEAEAVLDVVVADYSDVPSWRGTLGEQAASELFELRNLAIGMMAPEITGEDIFGEPLTLSSFQGQVVVLDFWGHW